MVHKVLYVDDNTSMLDLIKLLLEKAGYQVLTVKDVDDALRLAKGKKFGAMVIDINLAGDSGLMLMDFMMHNHKGVPIILYSGVDREDAIVEKMLGLGATQYVLKRDGSELVKAIKQVCPISKSK